MATDYKVNYDDQRLTEVESDKKAALSEVEKTYSGMINDSEDYFKSAIDASKEYAEKQSQIQQERTDLAIEEIEQQKEQTHKDYIKEQSGAYVDWQKQSGEYGANAEMMAEKGMGGTGYSESAQVSMYNTYQNRVATARETYSRAVLAYDNAIKDARLQNNAALAEIAYNALQTQLELALQGFQYKNDLIREKTSTKMSLDESYHNRYQDVLSQINTENAMAEEVRQFNEQMAEERRQADAELAEKKRQFNKEYELAQAQIDDAKKVSGGGSSRNAYSGGQSAVRKSRQGSKKSSSNSSSGSVKKDSGSKKTTKKSEPTVDMQSVLNLGFGPISASKLNSLVKSGVVVEYESGGKLKYKKSAATLKQSLLFK